MFDLARAGLRNTNVITVQQTECREMGEWAAVYRQLMLEKDPLVCHSCTDLCVRLLNCLPRALHTTHNCAANTLLLQHILNIPHSDATHPIKQPSLPPLHYHCHYLSHPTAHTTTQHTLFTCSTVNCTQPFTVR